MMFYYPFYSPGGRTIDQSPWDIPSALSVRCTFCRNHVLNAPQVTNYATKARYSFSTQPTVQLSATISDLSPRVQEHHFESSVCRLNSGPDVLSAEPCSEKNVGPFNWGDRPYFSWKKTGDFFCSSLSFQSGVAHFFRMQKFPVPFVGPSFCGSP